MSLSREKSKRLTGGEISALRGKLGLTQLEFAQQLGVTPGAVNHWEAGRSTPRPRIQRKLDALAGQSPATETKACKRYSPEFRAALIEGMDIILEKGPSSYVEDLLGFVQERAARVTELASAHPRGSASSPGRIRRNS